MLEIFIPLLTMLGVTSYVVGIRRRAIMSTYQKLARDWVSEGNIHSAENIYFTLKLENKEGNLIGSLATNTYNKLLAVYADVGWFNTTLYIIENSSKEIVAVATLKLLGHNHIEWSVIRNNSANRLPVKTVLWPCSQTVVNGGTIIVDTKPSLSKPQQPSLSHQLVH